MFRKEMPRVYELRDLIENPATPSAYFQDFDNSLRDEPSKKKTWLAREREFQRLDGHSWHQLKDEARPYLAARDVKGRGWEQLISILNQARAHNYLIDKGCSDVRFIPRAKKQGQKTPDLTGELNGKTIICEVKTINSSAVEVEKRQTGRAGLTTSVLDAGFFAKFDSTLRCATNQLSSYDREQSATHIVFVVINFDEWPGQYKSAYYSQIDCHLACNVVSGREIVFYNQRTAYHADVTMSHALVINEPS